MSCAQMIIRKALPRKPAHTLASFAFSSPVRLSMVLLLLLVFVLVVEAGLPQSSEWPYLQTYPPVNETDGRSPLHFALVLSFDGTYRSIGALPGVQIALDYINSDPSLPPGYTLHYTLTDSQVARNVSVD